MARQSVSVWNVAKNDGLTRVSPGFKKRHLKPEIVQVFCAKVDLLTIERFTATEGMVPDQEGVIL